MSQRHKASFPGRGAPGQALIEYALILVLVVMALAAAFIATGPALGNVFSNTVYNLLGQTSVAQVDLGTRGGPTAFWQTVTAVAENPPKDSAFPTNVPPVPSNTPSPGPSPTPTLITPSPSPAPSQTPKATATAEDRGYIAPFYDPADDSDIWRVDSSVFLGGDQDWRGDWYNNTSFSGPAISLWNQELGVGAEHRYNINFDETNDSLVGGIQNNNFSVRFTRNISLKDPKVIPPTGLTVNVSVLANGSFNFYLDGASVGSNSGTKFANGPTVFSFNIPTGDHQLRVDYVAGAAPWGIYVDIGNFVGNVPDDKNNGGGAVNCRWGRITGTEPNTASWTWTSDARSTGSDAGFSPNMTCNLEVRGWIDVTPLTKPTIAFWDAWETQAGDTIKLLIADYTAYSGGGTGATGGPNWAGAQTVVLHGAGSKNYAWTRYEIPLDRAKVKTNRIAIRFSITSGGGGGNRRWFLDDLAVQDMTTRTFTVCTGADKGSCGNYFDMENATYSGAVKPDNGSDFIASGRWKVVSAQGDNGNGSNGMWDSGSGTGKYVQFGPEQGTGTDIASGDVRIHSLEFNGKIDFTNINSDGTGGPKDWEGDDGYPELIFDQGYNIDNGESLLVQYTRDPYGATVRNWQTLVTLQANAGQQAMQQVQPILLNTIPNWNTSPFYLRFAMLVNKGATTGGGWQIDNIVFDRVGIPRYSPYAFCDDAENGTDYWLMSGQWGTINGGAFDSGKAFTDSPAGNYVAQQQTGMALRYPIDFNNNTPENIANFGGNIDCNNNKTGGPAKRPVMTFWHYRSLASGTLSVDISRPANAASGTTAIDWTPVWTYKYTSNTGKQLAWERVTIDLDAAIKAVTGKTLTQMASPPNTKYEDDFYVRIRLDTRGSAAVADGVYIDKINIGDYSELAFKLWDVSKNDATYGAGNGTRLQDEVEIPNQWWTRWDYGGDWYTADPDQPGWNSASMPTWWIAHSGTLSFTDSPPYNTNYDPTTFSVLNMDTIIDLRATLASDSPTLYFWTHYDIGANTQALVQLSTEDSTRTTQSYENEYGWGSSSASSSWETIWTACSSPLTCNAAARVDTWVRQQISLNPYVGKRIRLRFVVNALSTAATRRDGWYIDDIRVEFRKPRVFPLPFLDSAQNTQNWVTEGIWGLAPDLWRGSGGGPAALGPGVWSVYWFDCVTAMQKFAAGTTPTAADYGNQFSCSTDDMNKFLNVIPGINKATGPNTGANGTNNWIGANGAYPDLTDFTGDVNYDFGTSSRPFGADPGPLGDTWDDYYFGRFIRPITVAAGQYTFILVSDDGIRLRYDTVPGGNATPANNSAYWNIKLNWTAHGRTVDMNTVTLAAGNYNLQLEWFELTGSATVILQVGNNNFSFTDSPKASSSTSSPAVPSVKFGNSSLMLNGVLDLTNPNPGNPSFIWKPRLNYYTFYDLSSVNNAYVEVSIDGGFTWTQANLGNNCPGGGAVCSPTIAGATTYLPTSGDWQLRSHDLSNYANQKINLRFRLNTQSNVGDGWWITDIQAAG
jgi:Flp pilus assembly pilin Flp